MFINFGEKYIEISLKQSKKELTDSLVEFGQETIMLGEDSYATTFYLVTIYENSHNKKFGIGLCVEQHGWQPHMLSAPLLDNLLFGFNSDVVCIDCNTKIIKFSIKLPSLFLKFVSLGKRNMILIFNEIGITAIDEQGHCLWSYDKDVITEHVIGDNMIKLNFMDASPVNLSLDDGKEL